MRGSHPPTLAVAAADWPWPLLPVAGTVPSLLCGSLPLSFLRGVSQWDDAGGNSPPGRRRPCLSSGSIVGPSNWPMRYKPSGRTATAERTRLCLVPSSNRPVVNSPLHPPAHAHALGSGGNGSWPARWAQEAARHWGQRVDTTGQGGGQEAGRGGWLWDHPGMRLGGGGSVTGLVVKGEPCGRVASREAE